VNQTVVIPLIASSSSRPTPAVEDSRVVAASPQRRAGSACLQNLIAETGTQHDDAVRPTHGHLPSGDGLNDRAADLPTLLDNDRLAAFDTGEDGVTAGWAHHDAGQPRKRFRRTSDRGGERGRRASIFIK